MGILAEQVDHVIGVDTHRDSNSAVIVAAGTGAVVLGNTVSADAFGHKRLLRFARQHADGRRVWAIESSGSYGSGLATFRSRMASGSLRSSVPSGQRVAAARSPTSLTLSVPPVRRSPVSTLPNPVAAATARPSASC
jgi:hypothetical protein